LPPCAPPFAVIVPAIVVVPEASPTMRPPLPFTVASAVIVEPLLTTSVLVVAAAMPVAPSLARFSVVPSATVPPPALPETLIRACAPMIVVSLPETFTSPPAVPGALPSAVTTPSTRTSPPAPLISTRPVRDAVLLALICPPASTSVCTTPSTASAVSTTVPPRASITPELVTSALVPSGALATCLVTLIDTSPSPYRSSVSASAPARITVPIFAWILPELRTRGATRAASPSLFTVMVPRFSTLAPALAAWSNTILPAMKLLVLIPAAETTMPEVLICAPLSNTRPAWLTMTICPFAWILPAISDGLDPTTVFSVTALAFGCLYCTVCALPTL
jgi:hypothetical protein